MPLGDFTCQVRPKRAVFPSACCRALGVSRHVLGLVFGTLLPYEAGCILLFLVSVYDVPF